MQTVAAFNRPEEASLAKARLEGHGIAAHVAEEHSMNTDWMGGGVLGGIRVQVRDQDVDSAREVLEMPPMEIPEAELAALAIESQVSENSGRNSRESSRQRASQTAHCAKCGSPDWELAPSRWFDPFLGLGRRIAGLRVKRRWRCRVCRQVVAR